MSCEERERAKREDGRDGAVRGEQGHEEREGVVVR